MTDNTPTIDIEPADGDIYISRRDTLAGRDYVAECDREFVAQAWNEWDMVDAINAWMDEHGRRNAWLIDYRGQLEPFDVPVA